MDSFFNMLGEYGTIIACIPLVIFILVLVYNVVIGLIRGFRKNLILMIISLSALVIALLIFVIILKRRFFEAFVLWIYESIAGRSLNSVLGVDEGYKSFSTIICAYIQTKVSGQYVGVYENFSPYVIALANVIIGFVYMIMTYIIWKLLYYIGYFGIYLTIFREGKYKRKKNKEYYDSLNSIECIEEEKEVEVKPYSRHIGFGALIGVARGILLGFLSISIFGSLFFIISGGNDVKVSKDETIEITLDGKIYDASNLYEFFDDYGDINVVAESIRVGGVPVYASLPNIFCSAKIVIKEDGIKEKIYPVNELSHVLGILHGGVILLDKYNIDIKSSSIVDDLSNIYNANGSFSDDLYSYITSFGKSRFGKALGRTVTNHFVEIVEASGKSNYYFETIFKGENALNITDIVSKRDLRVFINIIGKSLALVSDYKQSKDIKDVVINSSDNITAITNEILNLSIFSSKEYVKINNITSKLLEKSLSKIKIFNGITLSGINWVTDGSTDGEIKSFVKSINKFLDSKFLLYEDNKIKIDFNKIDNLFAVDSTNESFVDIVSSSKPVNNMLTACLKNAKLLDEEIYIPQSALDSDGIIKSSETKKMLEAIKVLIEEADFTEDDIVTSTSIKDVILPKLLDSASKEKVSDAINSSIIISSAVSLTLYKFVEEANTNNPGLGIVIPDDLVLDKEHIKDNLSNWIGEDKELSRLLACQGVLDLTNVDGINDILDLNNDQISVLTASKIFAGTLNKKVNDANFGDVEVVVIEQAKDENGNISSEEIANAITSIKVLIGYDNLSEEDKANFSFDSISLDVSDILSNEAKKNSIFNSLILQSSVSYYVYNKIKTSVSVPSELELLSKDSTNFTNWITINNDHKELYYIVESICVLDLTDKLEENINIDANSVLAKLGDTAEEIDENVNKLVSSEIIYNEINDNIIDNASSSTYIIPSNAIEDGRVTKNEIKNVLVAAKEIGISDINNINTNILLENNSISYERLCASYIIKYKISDSIINCGISPSTYSYEDKEATEKYIKTTEIENTINALKVMGITDLENIIINETEILALYNDSEKIDTLLNSYIVYREISSQIFNANNIYVPSDVKCNPGDITLETNENYLTKDEIKNLLVALNNLGISSLGSYSLTNKLFSESLDLNTSLKSHIIWNSFSKEVLNCNNLIIIDKVIETIEAEKYINKVEIQSLVDILKKLGYSSLSSVTFTPANLLAIENGVEMAAENQIVRATISNKILYSPKGRALVSSIEYVKKDSMFYIVINETELINLIKGLNELGINEFKEISFNITSLTTLNIDIILQSDVLYLYISDRLKEIDENVLVDYDLVATLPESTSMPEEIVTKEYIKEYISA